MSQILLTVLFVSLANYGFTQNTVTSAQILATAKQDAHILEHQRFVQAAAQLPTRDGLFRNIESRIGINGSTLGDTIYGYIRNEDSYGLILSTNSLRERRHQNLVVQSEKSVLEALGATYLSEALKQRYEAILDSYIAQKEFEATNRWQALIHEQQRILRTQAEAGLEVKPDDIIESERNKLRAQQDRLVKQQQLRSSQTRLGSFLGMPSASLDTSGFIRLRQILAFIQGLTNNTALLEGHPDLVELKNKASLEKEKVALINSQNRQILQSVRLGYDRPLYLTRPNKFNTQNNLSVRVGLAVPLPGNNRFRKTQALIEQFQADLKLTEKTISLNTELQSLRQQILDWAQVLEQVQQENNSSLIPVYLQNPTLRSALSPLEINELQRIKHQVEELGLQTEHQLFRLYLEYLDKSGLLAAFPDRNWLQGE